MNEKRVTEIAIAAGLLLATTALAVALLALREARQPTEPPTYAEITAAGVSRFVAAGNQMTPPQVAMLLGEPTEVYRDNAKALCWRYASPYEIRMCWGPKRKQAWISTNIPRGTFPVG